MPKVTEAHLEARRKQILDAAESCFSRQGFHQTSMQDICREASLSPGAVYRYFSSKDDIIAASCRVCQQDNVDFIPSVTANGNGAIGMLDRLVDLGFGHLADPESIDHILMNIQLWAEAQRSPEIMEAYRESHQKTWQDGLTDILLRGQELGEIDPDLDAVSMARILMSSFQGLMLQKSLDPDIDVLGYAATLKLVYHRAFSTIVGASGELRT